MIKARRGQERECSWTSEPEGLCPQVFLIGVQVLGLVTARC